MFENKNYLYQLEEEIDTNDLYTNGKKLRILKSLIQSRKDIPTEKVILSKYAQQQLAVYNNKKKKILGSQSLEKHAEKKRQEEIALRKVYAEKMKLKKSERKSTVTTRDFGFGEDDNGPRFKRRMKT